MLGADIFVLEPIGLALGVFQQPGCPGSRVDLGVIKGHFGGFLQHLMEASLNRFALNAHLGQNFLRDALFQIQKGR